MLNITFRGQSLNQAQCDAVVPVINNNILHPMGFKNFESTCIKAMEAAGCPLTILKDYGVSWTLDVRSKDPKSAAMSAMEEMKKVDSRTLNFHVTDLETGKRYEVDLSADAGEEVVEL